MQQTTCAIPCGSNRKPYKDKCINHWKLSHTEEWLPKQEKDMLFRRMWKLKRPSYVQLLIHSYYQVCAIIFSLLFHSVMIFFPFINSIKSNRPKQYSLRLVNIFKSEFWSRTTFKFSFFIKKICTKRNIQTSDWANP